MACNEDDKDNVSSESGGGTSSAGSLGSISNTCGTVTSAKTFETSDYSSLSSNVSGKTLLEESTEQESHNNHNTEKSDTLEDDNAYVAPIDEVDSSVQPVELSSGKAGTSEVQVTDQKPKSTTVDQLTDPISFGWKTKVIIYGSVFSTIGYFIYTYWHIILMSLVALFFYEMWDWYSARKSKMSKERSD
jgi:hypothetical protein